ncbi:retinol dehydrogenase, partial [Auriculariales sp. MPI-PUGE-AT-0066]
VTDFSKTTTADEVVAVYGERVKGKTFLITGPSPASIGATTAYSLAAGGAATLILIGRSASKIAPVVDRICDINATTQVLIFEADLSSIASVRAAAQQILDSTVTHIDVMTNNAGIMAGPHKKSVDGVELQFATNHIGHFLLTNLLMPLLRASSDGGRVVSVSSSGHRIAELAPRWDPLLEHGTPYDQWQSYGFSKTANILFTKSLTNRGLAAYSVHPGAILTGLQANITPETLQAARSFFASSINTFPDVDGFRKSQEQGASTQVLAAVCPPGSFENGSYLFNCAPCLPSAQAQDAGGNLAEELWKLSERVVDQEFKA